MAGETNFTPGPWLLMGLTVYALDETGNCNRFTAKVEGGWSFRSSGTIGSGGDRTAELELEANARLLAAALELYEALEAAHPLLETLHSLVVGTDAGRIVFRDILRLRAILAKIGGAS